MRARVVLVAAVVVIEVLTLAGCHNSDDTTSPEPCATTGDLRCDPNHPELIQRCDSGYWVQNTDCSIEHPQTPFCCGPSGGCCPAR